MMHPIQLTGKIKIATAGKCCVISGSDDRGPWMKAGGSVQKEHPSLAEDEDDDSEFNAGNIYLHIPHNSIGPDERQSQIHFRYSEDKSCEVSIVFPDDLPFRASRRGMKDDSKSYDRFGEPVPQVRLLYALKTGKREDMVKALLSFPTRTMGGLMDEITEALETDEDISRCFFAFASMQLVAAAKLSEGLHDWRLWEIVADNGTAFPNSYRSSEKEAKLGDSFVEAVKKSASEACGVPMQADVRSKWEDAGGKFKNWKDTRKRLGFDWIPPKPEWEKIWARTNGWDGWHT